MKKTIVWFAFIVMLLTVTSSWAYGEKRAALPELKRPQTLAVDDTQLYVTEQARIYIYSLKDLKLVKQFGQAGQGPQEFQILPHVPVTVDVGTDRLVAASIRKISYFTKQGEYVEEVKGANLALNLKVFGKRFLGWSQAKYEGETYNTIVVFDAKLNKLKEIFRMKDSYQGPGRGYRVLHNVFAYQTYDGKILIPGADDASVDILDGEYKKLLSIRLDQPRRKVDADFKKKLIHHFKTSPEIKNTYPMLKPIRFPDEFPVISDFFVDNGMIYVMTWKREKGSNEFFVYDMKGTFEKRLMIPIRYETDLGAYPAVIKNGRLYQLVENEEKEEWELHVSTL